MPRTSPRSMTTLCAAAGSVVAALALAGCATGDRAVTSAPATTTIRVAAPATTSTVVDAVVPTPAAPPALRVVATLSPLADLVARVGGERTEVSSLIPPGADAHHHQLRPSDIAQLDAADAYVGLGLGLNDRALTIADEYVDGPVLRLGEVALTTTDVLTGDHHHSHSHSHSHDAGHGHDHDHGGVNPHVWTSLRNARALVDGIEQQLIDLDPDHGITYAANADALRTELDDLDRRIAAAVATIPADQRTLVVYHDAWVYFARDHGLELVSALQPSSYAEPSAADVGAVVELIRARGVVAVFGSAEFPDAALETIAAETGATYVGALADDVLPGLPGAPEHSYLELMRRSAATIVTALGGDATVLAP